MDKDNKVETVKGISFRTIFGVNFEIVPSGIVPREGGYEGMSFEIFSGGSKFSSAIIKISKTQISIWNLKNEKIKEVLFELGTLKIRILLESEEIDENGIEFTFSSYISYPTLKEQLDVLFKEFKGIRELHSKWQDMIFKSLGENRKLITNISRDYVDFQRENSKEIRSSLLQIVSVSSVIIAGLIALGRDLVSNDYFLIASLIAYALVVIFGFKHILDNLENNGITVFDAYKSMTDKLEDVSEKEGEFLNKPSVKAHKKILELWEKNIKEIKNRDRAEKMEKDKWLTVIRYIFVSATIFLLVSIIVPKIIKIFI